MLILLALIILVIVFFVKGIQIVQQREEMIIERLGKFDRVIRDFII